MEIIADKIGSVTKNVKIINPIKIIPQIISQGGYVIAVEVLEDKKFYNQLELPTGRMSTIHKGDILILALGSRYALKGYVGKVPEKLTPGDKINLLNLGGVAGICTSENMHEVGPAMTVKVLGAVIDKKKKPVTIYNHRLFNSQNKIKTRIPLIVISGTSMETGKTAAACEFIKMAARNGKVICAAKVSGIAALKDTVSMQDYGAKKVISIVDAGYPSTSDATTDTIGLAKGAINFLAKGKPDYIVIELGDGLLGKYGVMEILKDHEFQKNISAHIGCAYDPMGALKLFEISRDIGAPLNMISGPVTDNSVGKNFIRRQLGLKGINALTYGDRIFPYLYKKCLSEP